MTAATFEPYGPSKQAAGWFERSKGVPTFCSDGGRCGFQCRVVLCRRLWGVVRLWALSTHAPVAEERCYHNGQMPAPQQDQSAPRSPCPDHGYLVASLVPVAAPDITPGLQNGTPVTGLPCLLGGTAIRSVPVRDMLSHSPPGLSTGRSLLQRETLLRT